MRIEPRKSLWKKKRLVVVEKGENFEILRPTEIKPLEEQLEQLFRRKKEEMGVIDDFIDQINKDTNFKWVATKVILKDKTMGMNYEMVATDDFNEHYWFKVSDELLQSSPFEQIISSLENQAKERQMKYLYRKFEKMTPSMQKAVVDIMKTQNGEQIDDRENDI